MEIIIIAGVAKNNVIGIKNKLPWHISEDLKHFKELTTGHPVIMGRATYLSILDYLGKPLPNRTNIVLTDNPNDKRDGFIFCKSIPEALKEAEKIDNKVFVIGGASIYKQFMPLATKLEITHIHKEFQGDVFFPEIEKEWTETKREDKKGKDFDFSFVTYEKIEINQQNNSRKKGLFIAFEGIDGCGKSTQVKELAKYLFDKDKYNHIILTRNPYKNTDIRKILREDNNPLTKAEKLAELFINDRKKQVEELVLPALKYGHIVITDRYKLSTIAYQSTQGIKMEKLIEMQKDLPIPDICFIIDVSTEEAIKRIKKDNPSVRGKENKFEANIEFIKKLRENYKKAKEILKDEKIIIINGERKPEEIFNEIKKILLENKIL